MEAPARFELAARSLEESRSHSTELRGQLCLNPCNLLPVRTLDSANYLLCAIRTQAAHLDADQAAKPQPINPPVDLRFVFRHRNFESRYVLQSPKAPWLLIEEQPSARMNIKSVHLRRKSSECRPFIHSAILSEKGICLNLPHQMSPDVIAAESAPIKCLAELAEHFVPRPSDIFCELPHAAVIESRKNPSR